MKVLDTSAILRSDLDFSDGEYIITYGVLSELLEDGVKDLIDLAIGKNHIKVHVPGEQYKKAVSSKAYETGDLNTLSETDLEVLASCLENNAVLASDDYAMQNVAAALGIAFEGLTHKGISRQVTWERVCAGCGRKYDDSFKGVCPTCGHKIRRKASYSERIESP